MHIENVNLKQLGHTGNLFRQLQANEKKVKTYFLLY